MWLPSAVIQAPASVDIQKLLDGGLVLVATRRKVAWFPQPPMLPVKQPSLITSAMAADSGTLDVPKR